MVAMLKPCFSGFDFLLVSWLALTAKSQITRTRLLAYAVLGLVIGLALWSDQLILSAIFVAGIFWWLFCRKEARSRYAGVFVAGLLVGLLR